MGVGEKRIGVSAYRRGQKRVGVWAFGKDTKPLVNMEVALEQEIFNTFENNVVYFRRSFSKIGSLSGAKGGLAKTPTR
jgi:hypothetical protein